MLLLMPSSSDCCSSSSPSLTHKHHIIPKYEGGSDAADNITELTVTQHAMWHFAEWKRKKDPRDKLAWQGLAGIIGHEEVHRIASAFSSIDREYTPEFRQKLRDTWTDERKERHSKRMSELWADPTSRVQRTLGNLRRNEPHTERAKQRMSVAKKGRKWWNNGEDQCMQFECPDGWVRGRLR